MLDSKKDIEHGTHKLYLLGFLASILFTLGAYFLVVKNLLSGWALGAIITVFGLAQAFIQLLLFLHLGKEPKPRWNLVVFFFTLLVVVILVVGSLWIMYNLDYRMM